MAHRKNNTAFIGIGSNLGDRKANIDKAMELVRLIKGVRLMAFSSIYETEPAGGPPQGKFLNGVFKVETDGSPLKLLHELQKIEKYLGRKRTVKNGPRTIDLDILLFGNKRINTKKLKVPHPRMHKREFVLKGLRELEIRRDVKDTAPLFENAGND
ncbi:MAG: 2-amino-4-hydroxy-6-hydroxymethyldihydropteridine diphosphokinase [Candidatus Omnitrophica bacterium]|nr:2-amino-4-hydroxy-6-hydroxymethyldihydropteridine diphosphokinase [Candidatus Omnitrophota bacterium]